MRGCVMQRYSLPHRIQRAGRRMPSPICSAQRWQKTIANACGGVARYKTHASNFHRASHAAKGGFKRTRP